MQGRTLLQNWLADWNVKISASSLAFDAFPQITEPPETWISPPAVADGLKSFCELELREAYGDGGSLPGSARSRVIVVSLITAGRLRVWESPPPQTEVAVLRQEAIPQARSVTVGIPRLENLMRVRALSTLADSGRILGGTADWLLSGASIREATPQMRQIPHVCRSVDLRTIPAQLCESFLREAETVNGVTDGQGEVLAIFRNVPVAMISRLRFMEGSGVLLYTISYSAGSSRTRVHDIAAVRDRGTRTIHLVTHRTRYKTAFLS